MNENNLLAIFFALLVMVPALTTWLPATLM